MSLQQIVPLDVRLVTRKELLAGEKELARQRNVLSADRRRLPMVEITKDYTFEGPDGSVVCWTCSTAAASSWSATSTTTFHVTMDPSVAPVEYNYRSPAEHEQAGRSNDPQGEQPGMSCFLRDGDRVFHTYSMFTRGAESLGGSYYFFLDLTALDLTI